MLVQVRNDDCLWCITQHDHAKLSGMLAHIWSGLDGEEAPLSWSLVLATTLHDMPWLEEDQAPRYNPATGQPYSFVDLPWEDRAALYDSGLEKLAALDPDAALLVSLHYASFKGTRDAASFQTQEKTRRSALRQALKRESDDQDPALQRDLAYLQMFDLLSLALLLKAPAVQESSAPAWLLPKNVAYTPAGTPFAMHWVSEHQVRWEPYPWRQPVDCVIPYRRLPGTSFADASALAEAWRQAPLSLWKLKLSP